MAVINNSLVAGAPAESSISTAGNYFFPFTKVPSYSWMEAPRCFGANRKGKDGKKRAHAGCDLYFPLGTIIHAVADGIVILGPQPFYCQTSEIQIDHGAFIARYGEVQQKAMVKKGDKVTAGQPIAKVGHLVGIIVPSDMLHFEMYSKSAAGSLTVETGGKLRSDGVPFMRRSDLIDPTQYLNKWKSNLPT